MSVRAKLHLLIRELDDKIINESENKSDDELDFKLRKAVQEEDYINALVYLVILIDEKEVLNERKIHRNSRANK